MRSKRTNELFDLGSFFFRCAIDEDFDLGSFAQLVFAWRSGGRSSLNREVRALAPLPLSIAICGHVLLVRKRLACSFVRSGLRLLLLWASLGFGFLQTRADSADSAGFVDAGAATGADPAVDFCVDGASAFCSRLHRLRCLFCGSLRRFCRRLCQLLLELLRQLV